MGHRRRRLGLRQADEADDVAQHRLRSRNQVLEQDELHLLRRKRPEVALGLVAIVAPLEERARRMTEGALEVL